MKTAVCKLKMAETKKSTSVIDEEFMKKRRELFENKEVQDINSGSFEEKTEKSISDEYIDDTNKTEIQSSIDDINKLLESVGIEPISMTVGSEEKSEEREFEKTRHFGIDKNSDSKTKYFSVGGKSEITAEKEASKVSEKAQMIFDGYEDEEPPAHVSEEEVEKELQKSRKNLIENFRVLSKNENDKPILEKNYTGAGAESIFDSVEVEKGETLFEAVERAGSKASDGIKKLGAEALKALEKKAFREKRSHDVSVAKDLKQKLLKSGRQSKHKTIALLVIFALSVIFGITASVYTETNNFSSLFANGAKIFTAINLIFLIASMIVSFKSVKKGIEKFVASSVDVNSCALVLDCFVIIHSIIVLITGMTAEQGIYSFTPCAIFASLCIEVAELIKSRCIVNDVSVMLRGKSLMGVRTVENKNEAAAIASGLSKKGEPKLVYPSDADFSDNYDEIASTNNSHEKIYSIVGIAAIVCAIVISAFSSIIQKDATVFATGLVSTICLCAPFMRHLISVMLKMKNDKLLSVSGVVVSGYDSAREIGKANAFIVDTDEIFVSTVSKFKTVAGGRMARSDAVVYAAATLKNSRSILKNAFDDYLDSIGINLPEAEDLQYEDKLGYSCWVAGRRVLVGNREMLVQHSIVAPSEEEEKQYESKRSVMYVAVEGVIAATFVVSYNVRRELKNLFRSLNNSGLVLILNTGDPCLDEKFVAKKLFADVAAVKIASSKAAGIIERCRKREGTNKKTGLFYSKEQKNALLLFYAAHNLYEAEKFAGIIHLCGLALSFIILAVCIILKLSSFFAPITIIMFQLLWSAVSYFIGSMRIK